MDYKILLEIISERYQHLLRKNLVGIYIHGSIAFGCFSWARSDIDFIVVVEDVLSQQMKKELFSVLEKLCGLAPEKGFEMSVVQKKYCKNFIYPTPYELHFSNSCRTLLVWNNEIKTDYDLAAHFTVIKNVGLVLFGEPIAEVFGIIPKAEYLDSIRLDIKNAKEDVLDNPVYVILNLCRVYAYIIDEAVLSKEQGGQWGLKNLPKQYHNLITNMLNNYAIGTTLTTNQKLQIDFCEYMLDQIM